MKQPVHKICPQTLHSPPFSLRGEGPLLVPTGLPNTKRHGNIHPDKTAGILRHWGRAHPNDNGLGTNKGKLRDITSRCFGMMVQSEKGSSTTTGPRDVPCTIKRAMTASTVHQFLQSKHQNEDTPEFCAAS